MRTNRGAFIVDSVYVSGDSGYKEVLVCLVCSICALRFIGIKGIVELLKYSVEKEETQFAARDTFGWVLLVVVLFLMLVHSYLQHKGV